MSVRVCDESEEEPWWLTGCFVRKYGGPPPGWDGPKPSKGCEVFVGKLPREALEDVLLPVLSRAGRVYELRLMMDFSGNNRGYCFVTYASPQEARKACRELNNLEMEPNRHIGVVMSVDNCRLFIGNIPRDKSQQEVYEQINQVTEGVEQVILYPMANDKTKNRGFAFVEYSSHRAAAMARRKLMPGLNLWGQPICADWAEPEQDVDEETMSKVKILYVRNLMPNTTEEHIRSLMEGEVPGSVERVKKIKDYAFVHFHDRGVAQDALDLWNGNTIDNALVEVTWAKPADRSFMRYVKTAQKQAIANAGPVPVHHSIVAAAAAQLYAQTACNTASSTLSSSGSCTPPSPGDAGHATWAYAGMPFIDPGFKNFSNQRLSQFGMQSNNRMPRGAAGMRGAGFQAFVSNQVRRNRRRYSEAAVMYDILPYCTPTVPYSHIPQTPVFLMASMPPQYFPMAYPVQYQQAPLQSHAEQLDEQCRIRNWGVPEYELSTIVTKEGGGRNINLYIYRVSVPSMVNTYGSFLPNKPSTDTEEAKEYAALFALIQLGLPHSASVPEPVSPQESLTPSSSLMMQSPQSGIPYAYSMPPPQQQPGAPLFPTHHTPTAVV